MAHEEAAFSRKHSAVSENQHQHQHQRPFTAEPLHGADAEDAEVEKGLSRNHGKPDDEQERVQQRAQALAIKLAQTYEELTRLLERNPGMKREITEGTTKEDKVYQKLKQRLKMADMAPRCQWVRQDGTSCRSPQMKRHIYCFAHMQMAEARTLMLMLPAAEDANAIQVGLMQIQKALIEDRISMKKAGLLLYSMQLAMTNVGQTTFGQAKDEEMVRETVDEEEALSRQQAATSEEQHPPRRHGGTEEEQGLPRMDADERGWKNPKPIVWKPTPDMYRMDTKEGREAYEASLRSSGERRPVQPVIPPQPAQKRRGPGTPVIAQGENAETCNSSLRDERLPKGPRFACESLDADTGVGSVLQTESYAVLG